MSGDSTPLSIVNPLDVPPTTVDLDYADLPIIDLSRCETYEGRCQLAHQVYDALAEAGFFYVVNHGTSLEQVKEMFSIADIPFSRVDDQEKERYTTSMKEGGLYQGYKAKGVWHIQDGVLDQFEIYNINRNVNKREHPEALRPFLSQISTFARYTHINVLHQILRLLSLGLELPEDTLVNLHSFEADGETAVRFNKYYPRSEEDELKCDQVWLMGHADIGTVTILYSQPISGLQVLSQNGTWKWVRHIENALIINTGDAMKVLSGGIYRSTIHRVVQPPHDQRNRARLGVVYFGMTDDQLVLAPLSDSPVVRRAGLIDQSQDGNYPTMRQWRLARAAKSPVHDNAGPLLSTYY